MSDLHARFDALEDRVEDLEPRVSKVEQMIGVLTADLAEMRAKFPYLATREDVAKLGERLASKIDGSVGGLLRDALAAEPAYRMRWWAAAGVFVALGSMIVSLLAVLYH